MSARRRLLLTLALILTAIVSPPWGGLGVAAIALGAVVIEGAAARAWRSFRAPALTVAIAIALQAWLGGRQAALVLGARVAGATSASAWLIATTRPGELIAALRGLGLPRALGELVALAARYVSVLGETLTTAREAQRVRLGWQRLPARLRSFGALGGVVVGRAVDQSVALGEAMRARGGLSGPSKPVTEPGRARVSRPQERFELAPTSGRRTGCEARGGSGLDAHDRRATKQTGSAAGLATEQVLTARSKSAAQGAGVTPLVTLHGAVGYRGRPVLRDLSLGIAAGQRVAVVGGNGAGKTTLLRALMGLLPVDGTVTVGGRCITRAEEAVDAGVGLVFQNPDDQLFEATVADDVRFGPRNQQLATDEIEQRAERALAALEIGALAERPIEELSFGEKKRACVAGVLAMRPSVLLLDEPTAGLDPRGEEALVTLLAGLDATLIVATHAVDIVPRLCDRVLVLAGGTIAADGSPRAVFARADLLRAANLRGPYAEAWVQA
jgi:cobalt/nickel transport system ATP-binding protein